MDSGFDVQAVILNIKMFYSKHHNCWQTQQR